MGKLRKRIAAVVLVVVSAAVWANGGGERMSYETRVVEKAQGARKVILDTDMVELFDDGMAMILLDRSPHTELLGVTVVSGNTPMPRGMATGVRQLEAIGSTVPLYAGSRYGIRSWRAVPEVLSAELAISPVVSWGGYLRSAIDPETYSGIEFDPMARWAELYKTLYNESPVYPYVYDTENPDPQGRDEAVDFLVDTVNMYPGEVTIVAIGPLTNIARAIMRDPSFPSKVKEIIYMGGSFFLPGNSSAAAEFNWWADPDAAKIALRAVWGDPESESYKRYGNQVISGLEANHNTGGMPLELYKKMVAHTFPGLQPLFYKRGMDDAPTNIWDLFAAAYLIDPSIVLSWNNDPRPADNSPQPIYGVYVDVNAEMGPDYGRSIAYEKEQGPVGSKKAAIQNFIDEEKFWNEIVYPLLVDPENR